MLFDCPDPPPLLADPPPLVSSTPVARGPQRVQLTGGLWYDRFSDGTLEYCKECNKGKLPPVGSVVTQEEHRAIIKAGITVPAVTVRPFRQSRSTSAGYDPDHQCNQCGASQYMVSGSNGQGHTHTCNRCGNVWWH